MVHKCTVEDFLGGSMVRNLPANAGDTGLILDLGRSYMLWSSSAHVPHTEPVPLNRGAVGTEDCVLHKRSHHHEKPMHCN